MKPVRLEDEANAELQDAAEWYEGRRPGLGRQFLHAVDVTFEQIARMPQTGSPMARVPATLGIRRVRVRQFPYTVAYLETPDAIRILAVIHDRRRPGYWFSRV